MRPDARPRKQGLRRAWPWVLVLLLTCFQQAAGLHALKHALEGFALVAVGTDAGTGGQELPNEFPKLPHQGCLQCLAQASYSAALPVQALTLPALPSGAERLAAAVPGLLDSVHTHYYQSRAPPASPI